jgi:hypothetical protein
MTPELEARIERQIRAEDIKHEGRLTDDQIASINTRLVFEWVKTGQWNKKNFHTWLKVMRVIE